MRVAPILLVAVLLLVLQPLVGRAAPASKDRTKPAQPKVYENAEHKFRFTVPDSWAAAGAGCQGAIYNFGLPPDFSSVKADKDGTKTVVADMLTVAVNPANDPTADLDAAVAEVQAALKAEIAERDFKPVEKAKVAGGEARLLTATIPAKQKGGPRRVERHTVFLKDGKVFEIILFSYQNSVGRSTGLVNNVVRSFQWTDTAAAKPAESAQAK